MSKYSDWRTDLREVMDDDTDEKKVSDKKVNNAKLIKINPKLGEAVEELGGQIIEMKEVDDADDKIEKDADADKKAAMADKVKKKEAMLKKRIVRMKMMAVNQGAADSIVAGYEPEGEVIDEAERKLADRLQRKRELYKKTTKKALEYARREGEAAGHARYRMGSIDREIDGIKAKMNKEEVVLERLGGKGYKPYTSLTGKKISGDWEDSDRGAGNKAKKRAGGKVEKKSPTYRAYVLNKEGYEEKKTSEVLAAFKRDPKVRKRFEKVAKKENGPGSVKNRAADSMLQTAKDTAKRKGDTSKSDDRYAYEETNIEVREGVMKMVKRVMSKKKTEKKPEKAMDAGARARRKLQQKDHETVNFLPMDEGKGYQPEIEVIKSKDLKKKERESKLPPHLQGDAIGKMKKAFATEEDKAFNFVLDKIRKEVGKGGYVSKNNPRKPQSAADKAKVRAHQAKVDAENAAERKKDPSQGRYPKG